MKKMKKLLATALTLILVITLSLTVLVACANDEKKEIIVFAAASMRETLTEIGKEYMEANKNVNIIFTFDSSGTLKTQIESGAECDIFISAAPKQMNELAAEKLDLVLTDTRFNLLENKVVLCVAEGNPKNINSFEDMKAALTGSDTGFLMAIGNSDVPVGQYTQKIFNHFEITESAVESRLNYCANVKAVTTAIAEKTVACGIIYATDAFSEGILGNKVAEATEAMCGQVIYPAAIIKGTKNQETAQAFLNYLKGETATTIFENVGFTALAAN